MKNKDIQKAVKSNELGIMNARTLNSMFSSFTSFYLRNEIYQKMQRETLYNFYKAAYFIVVLFVLQNEENFERSNFDC